MINANIPNKASQSIKDAAIAKNFQELINREKTDVKKDENGVENILIGYQEDGFNGENYGIKVSQQGFDVREATDDQLVFSSAFNLFKIVDSGTTVVTVPVGHTAGNLYSTSVPHSLGYPPTVIAFANRPNATGAYNLLPYTVSSYNAGTARWEELYGIRVSSSDSDLTFVVNTNNITAIQGDWQVRYYILAETAS